MTKTMLGPRQGTLLRSNKRGTYILFFGMIGMVVGVFIALFFSLTDQGGERFLGERHLQVLVADEQAQKFLLYLDQSARYAITEALVDLASHGGFAGESPCGEYYGYALWQSAEEKLLDDGKKVMDLKECYPDSEEGSFSSLLSIHLKTYLAMYPKALPDLFYTITTRQDPAEAAMMIVSGAADKDVTFDIVEWEQKVGVPLGGPLVPSVSTDISCGVIPLVEIQGVACGASICAIHPEVEQRLLAAEAIAEQQGYELYVNSAYRSISDQRYLWEHGTRAHPEWKDLPPEQRREFVSPPSCNAPHTTGRAVDVVLKSGGQFVEMNTLNGIKLAVSDMSHPERQRLESIMASAGFVRYVGEYWHYEYGTTRWHRAKERGAVVG